MSLAKDVSMSFVALLRMSLKSLSSIDAWSSPQKARERCRLYGWRSAIPLAIVSHDGIAKHYQSTFMSFEDNLISLNALTKSLRLELLL